MIETAAKIVGGLLDQLIPDSDARAAAEKELQKLEQSGQLQMVLSQMAVNQQEAAHSSLFVAGWRPFIGWVCGVSLAYQFVLYEFLRFVVAVLMEVPPELPQLDGTQLSTILMGMLGLGGMRTYEKLNQVAREQ